MIEEEKLRRAIRLTQEELRAGIGHAGIVDVAFIGNTSGVYIWEPAMIVDIDVCLFVESTGREVGCWLLALGDRLRAGMEALGVDFELKVVRGPYKPAAWRLERPVAVAHVAVFTESAYRELPRSLRWSWRKYRCVVVPDRMFVEGDEAPGWQELQAIAERKLFRIEAGRVLVTQWELPDFMERLREFTTGHPIFAEYCLAGPLICARVHGRILRRAEADQLSNRDYVEWYRREIMETAELKELFQLKERARQRGYEGLIPSVNALASRYLSDLIQHIDSLS